MFERPLVGALMFYGLLLQTFLWMEIFVLVKYGPLLLWSRLDLFLTQKQAYMECP